MRIEDGSEEQQHQKSIDDKGKSVIEAVVQHDDEKAEHNAGSNPDDLHARTGGQTENIGLTIGIAGSTDTDPPKRQQGDIEQYRPPVY